MENEPHSQHLNNDDWRHKAACKGKDPELFFPIGRGKSAQKQAEKAKAFCRGCPVATECLEFAFENRLDYGIWGGMEEGERRELRKRDKAPNLGEAACTQQIIREA